MSPIRFQFKDLWLLMKKHTFITFIMIVFVTIILLLFGKLYLKSEQTDASAAEYDAKYAGKMYFQTREILGDRAYTSYIGSDPQQLFPKLTALEQRLLGSDKFRFIELAYQPVEIFSPEIPIQFLSGYESGNYENAISMSGDQKTFFTNALHVSASFFDEFNIKVEAGEPFSEDDYIYHVAKPMPVLLGSEYKDYFALGDTLDGLYNDKPCRYIVKGFLDEKAFYYRPQEFQMQPCSRYILIPATYSNIASSDVKFALLQKIGGLVSSPLSFEETKAIFDQYKQELGIDENTVSIVDPYSLMGKMDIFEQYSHMTDEVSNQFHVLVIIIMLFGTVASTVTLCGMLRENRGNFGIEMLCGASRGNIFMVALLFLLTVLLTGDAICSSILFGLEYSNSTLLNVQLAVLAMLLLSAAISAFYIKKMDMHDIIGGNE